MKFLLRNKKFIIFISIISFLFFGKFIFAYDEVIVHPSLTAEMAKLYNLNYSEKLTDQEIEWMKKGSKDEDDRQGLLIRSGNHFYNPFGIKKWADDTLIGNSVPEPKLTAKEWAHNSLEQDSFPGGDFTWERAIWDYVNGDKQRAYESLGHIMHLIEDSAVPAHTRNDLHISPNDKDLAPYQNLPHFEEIKKALQDGEPYEAWTGGKAWDQNLKFDFAENLFQAKKALIALNNIDEYFDNIAKYTNTKFFSKDTIYAYSEPKSSSKEGSEKMNNGDLVNYIYGMDENGNKIKLAKISYDKNKNQKIYTLIELEKEVENNIHSDYWSRLAPRAVLTGAGIIKLFKDEVNKATQNPQSIERPKSIASVYGPLSPAVKAADPAIRTVATVGQLLANAGIYTAGKTLIAGQNIIISAYNSAKSAALGAAAQYVSPNAKATLVFDISQPIVVYTPAPANLAVSPNVLQEEEKPVGQDYSAELEILNQGQNLTFAPNEDISLSARVKNIGNVFWQRNMISLNAYMPEAEIKNFYHPSWLTSKRPAVIQEDANNSGLPVAPGASGVFVFKIKSPQEAGKYFFRVRPVWQDGNNFNWLSDDIAVWTITVKKLETQEAGDIDNAAASENNLALENQSAVPSPAPSLSPSVSPTPSPIPSSAPLAPSNVERTPFISYSGGSGSSSAPAPTLTPAPSVSPTPTPDPLPTSSPSFSPTPTPDIIPPEKISNFAAVAGSKRGTIKLNWDKPEEKVSYEIRCGEKEIVETGAADNQTDWQDAAQILEAVDNDAAQIEIGGSAPFVLGKIYYFAIKAKDEAGNVSEIFDSVSARANAAADYLVISEIQIAGGIGHADDEFIELYNPTDLEIDLTNYTINKKIKSGTDSVLVTDEHFKKKVIKARGYLLLAHTDYYQSAAAPDIWWPKSYSLTPDNSLIVYDSQKQIIDKIGFGQAVDFETLAFPDNPSANQSLERKANFNSTAALLANGADEFLGNGWDSDNNSEDFVLQTAPNPQNSESITEPALTPARNFTSGLNYPTIQWAIDSANAGDEIHIDSGVYYENVIINKQLTLKGIDTGAGKPVVDAGGIGNGINLAAGNITINGFAATGSASGATNAGIFVNLGFVSSNNNVIINNDVLNNTNGIYLQNSSNNTISGNNISNNKSGFHLANSNNNTLKDNNVSNNTTYGIVLDYSGNNALENNIINLNDYAGISLGESDNNTINSNTISNSNHGIVLSGQYNQFIGNIIKGRSDGFFMANGYNNTIKNNNISLSHYSLHIFSGADNKIYHNNFTSITDGAFDVHGMDIWDDDYPSGGNYWSDYQGTDSNNDGIADAPVVIPCTALFCQTAAQDRYPLMSPYAPPTDNDEDGELPQL